MTNQQYKQKLTKIVSAFPRHKGKTIKFYFTYDIYNRYGKIIGNYPSMTEAREYAREHRFESKEAEELYDCFYGKDGLYYKQFVLEYYVIYDGNILDGEICMHGNSAEDCYKKFYDNLSA